MRNTPDPTLTRDDARHLVDMYYRVQLFRVLSQNMSREKKRPGKFLESVEDRTKHLEHDIQYHLGQVAKRSETGRWLLSVHGIGPVLAAGLLAHLDITAAHAPSSFWRFAGLDPTITWGKGEKRPYNARLKTLCWKIGQSFMKNSSRKNSYYGRLYLEYKEQLVAANERGDYAERAAELLKGKRWKDGTVSRAEYEAGRLPKAHIDAMARRWVVKLFLSHVFEKMWAEQYPGKPAPVPYVFEHMGHVHRIPPPEPPPKRTTACKRATST